MRKHFLILMLLTLLPLSTWADEKQSIEEGFVFTLGTTTAQYNGQVPTFTPKLVNNNLTTPVILTYGTDYELEFYKNNEKLEDAPSAVGSYTVMAHGIGDYKDYTANAIAVTITKAHITVTIGTEPTTGAWTFQKAYHAADPAMPAVSTWTFAVDNGETLTQDAIKDKLTIPATPTYTYDGENANADKIGTFLSSATAGYAISFPGIEVNEANDENYDVEFTPRSMKICQVELAAAGTTSPFTYETAHASIASFAGYTYTGAQPADNPTVKYKWGTGENDVYTLTDEDVVITYYDATLAEATPRDAGAYTAKITAGTSGNFVDPTTPGITIDEFAYTINRAQSLTILVNPISRAYNAKAFAADEAKFTVTGWTTADAGTKVTGLAAVYAGTTGDFAPGQGTYPVKLVFDDYDHNTFGNAVVATRKDNTTFNPSDNYEIVTFQNTWTITTAPLTFTVGEKTIQSGTAPTTDGVDFEVAGVQKQGGIDTNPLEAVKDAFKVVLIPEETTGQYANVNPTGYDAFTVARKVKEDYTGADDAEKQAKVDAADAILANYSYTDASITKGKLKVTGVGFTIMPVASDITYGEAFVPDYFAYTGTTQVVLSQDETNKLKYIVKKGETTYTEEQYALLPAGEYTVAIDMTNMTDLLPSGNYDVEMVNPLPVTFNVSEKELTLTIADVTLLVGDTQENLQKQYPISDATPTGVIAADADKVKFVFSFDPDKVNLNATTKKIESLVDGTGAIKIGFDTTTGDDTYLNYKFPAIAPVGNLTLSSEYILELDRAATNMAEVIDDANANGNKYTVKFKSMPMNEKEWYAMVVPFATTPYELVEKLGVYVTVNRFKQATINDATKEVTVNFKVEMDEIPAGEPFLIKPGKAINWKNKNYDPTLEIQTGAEISFPTKDIAANPQTIGLATDKANFTGTYNKGEILQWGHNLDGTAESAEYETIDDNTDWTNATLKYRWLSYNGAAKNSTETYNDNKWKNCKKNPHTLAPMEAYLILNSEALSARVFVEDFENGVTSIKSLSSDEINGVNVKAEGWYTIDGMKLNAAPTQKGVYINNGKKIVVK